MLLDLDDLSGKKKDKYMFLTTQKLKFCWYGELTCT